MWQSPILLTPYLPDYTIDTAALAGFIARCYADAGLARAAVDSGAVILTGEALKRKNARAIADLFSEEAGKFVCASAGHHMECQMAAHGSGAMRLSKSRGVTVLNVDIGGGTTKFALIKRGELLATAAIAVGGRLVVADRRLTDPARGAGRHDRGEPRHQACARRGTDGARPACAREPHGGTRDRHARSAGAR